jgi:hypothetical protein
MDSEHVKGTAEKVKGTIKDTAGVRRARLRFHRLHTKKPLESFPFAEEGPCLLPHRLWKRLVSLFAGSSPLADGRAAQRFHAPISVHRDGSQIAAGPVLLDRR